MHRLIPINSVEDIPGQYRETPIELLFKYHNFDEKHETYSNAQMLIGMCMDYRKYLRIPDNFAYILRTGGANLRYSEFKVSFSIAVGNVKTIALMGHTHCRMVNVGSSKDQFITGLVENGGVERQAAEDQFNRFAPMFEIGNEVDFILSEVKRLRLAYPKIIVAPLIYKVEDNRLYLIDENG